MTIGRIWSTKKYGKPIMVKPIQEKRRGRSISSLAKLMSEAMEEEIDVIVERHNLPTDFLIED